MHFTDEMVAGCSWRELRSLRGRPLLYAVGRAWPMRMLFFPRPIPPTAHPEPSVEALRHRVLSAGRIWAVACRTDVGRGHEEYQRLVEIVPRTEMDPATGIVRGLSSGLKPWSHEELLADHGATTERRARLVLAQLEDCVRTLEWEVSRDQALARDLIRPRPMQPTASA